MTGFLSLFVGADADLWFEQSRTATGRAPARLGEPVFVECESAGAASSGKNVYPVSRGPCGPNRVAEILFDVGTFEAEIPRE